jgi:hypothetical protein
MRNLSPEQVAEWTRANVACDLSDFAIPTTQTAPWGEPGELVRLELHVDPGEPEPRLQRTVRRGVWERDRHALVIPMPTRRDPAGVGAAGLCGLVRVDLHDGMMERKRGFIVHGQALLEDEDKLHAIVNAAATAEIDRLVASFSAHRALLPAPQDENPGPRM